MVLSYTKINSYMACPKKFYFTYIEKIPIITSEALAIGTMAHQLIELYSRQRMENKRVNPADIVNQVDIPYSQKEEAEELFYHFLEWLGRAKLNFENVIGIEYSFGLDSDLKLCGYSDENVVLHGIVDRVDYYPDYGRLIITDYKSSYAKASPVQLYLYATAFANNPYWDVYEIWVINHYLKNNFLDIRKLTEDEIDATAQALLNIRADIVNAVNENRFPEIPNTKCIWCPYLHLCQSGKQYHDSLENKTIQEIATEYVVLNARINDYKQHLKDYCNEYGAIRIGNTTIETKQRKRVEVSDVERLEQLLIERGFEPGDYIKVKQSLDMNKLQTKKVMEAIPELEAMIVHRPYGSLLTVNDNQ